MEVLNMQADVQRFCDILLRLWWPLEVGGRRTGLYMGANRGPQPCPALQRGALAVAETNIKAVDEPGAKISSPTRKGRGQAADEGTGSWGKRQTETAPLGCATAGGTTSSADGAYLLSTKEDGCGRREHSNSGAAPAGSSHELPCYSHGFASRGAGDGQRVPADVHQAHRQGSPQGSRGAGQGQTGTGAPAWQPDSLSTGVAAVCGTGHGTTRCADPGPEHHPGQFQSVRVGVDPARWAGHTDSGPAGTVGWSSGASRSGHGGLRGAGQRRNRGRTEAQTGAGGASKKICTDVRCPQGRSSASRGTSAEGPRRVADTEAKICGGRRSRRHKVGRYGSHALQAWACATFLGWHGQGQAAFSQSPHLSHLVTCGRHSVQSEADYSGPCTCLWSAFALQFEVACGDYISGDQLRHWPVWGDRRQCKGRPTAVFNPAADFDRVCAGLPFVTTRVAGALCCSGAHSLTAPLDPPVMGPQVLTVARVRDEPAGNIGQLPSDEDDLQGRPRAVQVVRCVQSQHVQLQDTDLQMWHSASSGEGSRCHRQVRFHKIAAQVCFDWAEPASVIAGLPIFKVPTKAARLTQQSTEAAREFKVGSTSNLAPLPCLLTSTPGTKRSSGPFPQSQQASLRDKGTTVSRESKVGSLSSLAHSARPFTYTAGTRSISAFTALSQPALLSGECAAISRESKVGSMSSLAHLPPYTSAGAIGAIHNTSSPGHHELDTWPEGFPAEVSRKVARGPILRRPGSIALLRADSVAVTPADRRAAPIFEGPLSRFAWGGQNDADEATIFVVFDHVRHLVVERCARDSSLHDVVALAITDAPFQVGGVQVLTDVLPGLPALQIVLAELRRPIDELPIPWDLRLLGEPIKTVRHRSLQESSDAILDVQQTLRTPRNFREDVATGAIIVQDSMGDLRNTLPRQLEEVQFFRASFATPARWDPGHELDPTTTTTSITVNEELITRPVRRPRFLEGVEVLPSRTLTAPAAHLPASSLGLFPHFRREESGSTPYHLLLRGFHPLRRIGQSRWTLVDFCDHAAMDINGTARCVQVLTTNIPGLLQPQIVVTASTDDATAVLLPVDLRAAPGGEVVPIMLRPGMQFDGIVAAIDAELPGCRECFEGLGGEGSCHFVDSQGLLVEILPASPQSLQWLELRPTAPPFRAIVATTVTSTPAAEDNPNLCIYGSMSQECIPRSLPEPVQPSGGDPPNLLRLEPSGTHAVKPLEWSFRPSTLSAFGDTKVSLKSWGAADPETRHLFTVFDTARHCTVLASEDAVSVLDFAHRAAASAPQRVRSIQILTAPVAGLPLPQLVLTFFNDGPNVLAVPWDGRSAGLPIRTLAHQPGEHLGQAAFAYQHAQVSAPHFEAQVRNGALVILDVAGVVDTQLPPDLTEIQFLRVEPRFGSAGSLDVGFDEGRQAGLFQRFDFPGLASVSSTTTTTQPMTFRLSLFYRHFATWRDVRRPCVQLDLYVEAMLHELISAGCVPPGPLSITLAKAHPPPSNFVQEVLFIVMPMEDFPSAQAIFDSRQQGGHIAADAVPEGLSADRAVTAEWRQRGYFSLVNGAPEQLVDRPVEHGDYLQVGHASMLVPHTAASEVMDQLHHLEAYGWPIEARTRNDDSRFVARIRERRRRLRVWLPTEALCTILGPTHGPVRFRLEYESVPSVVELRSELSRISDFNSMRLALAHTVQLVPGAALFVSVAPNSDARTILLPKTAVRSCAHYVVLMVMPRTDNLGWLPIEPTCRIVFPPGRWQHGHILSLIALPANMGRIVPQHVRPPAPVNSRPTLSPSGRVVPRSGTSLVQIRTDVAEKVRLQRRCEAAARAWGLPSAEPCVQGLPSSVHLRLEQESKGPPVPAPSIPTPMGRRTLPRASACPIQLATSVPPPGSAPLPATHLRLGVSSDAFGDVFDGFALDRLCQISPDPACLPEHVRRFLEPLPLLQSTACEALQIYVDGSYFPAGQDREAKAGWALCVLAFQRGLWHFAGYLAATAPIAGGDTTLDEPVRSSFEVELAAVMHALAVAVKAQVPTLIGYDNSSAGAVAFGTAGESGTTHMGHACLELQHFLRLCGVPPVGIHVRSHQNHPANDLADALARGAADLPVLPGPSSALKEAQISGVLPWLWAACNLHHSLPTVAADGILTINPAPERGTALSDVLPTQPEPQGRARLDFSVITYNCLSLQGIEQLESLDWQFYQANAAIVALQETRTAPGRRSASNHFHILASDSIDGQLGCQIWLRKDGLMGRDSLGGLNWDPSSFSILYSRPRILLVSIHVGSLRLAVLSAHALTSQANKADIEAWWEELSGVLRRVPHGFTPLLCVDANAHFDSSTAPPDSETARNHNALCLSRLLADHQLTATATCRPDGVPIVTWIGPSNTRRCLDFVAAPTALASGLGTVGQLEQFTGKVDHDHLPLRARLSWSLDSYRTKKAARIDTKQMLTAQGRLKVRKIFDATPRVAWDADVDTHLSAINTHLTKEIAKAFPAGPTEPRSYVLQPMTWNLVQDRRDMQRHLHRHKQAQRLLTLRIIWDAFRGQACTDGKTTFRFSLQVEALHARQLRDLKARLRDHKRRDVAEATRQATVSAVQKGPEDLYRYVRQILKCGRRYRAPAIQPAIQMEDGSFAQDAHLHLGKHFAIAERAILKAASDIHTTPMDPPQAPLQAHKSLSVASLARGFGSLAVGKATGPSGLPMELYKADPIGAASVHQPLLLKAQIQGVAPALWRGGHNVPIPKPGKPIQSVDAWRAILLCESSLKGVCKAMREPLLASLDKVKSSAQGGSRPGAPLQIPMAFAQGHLRALHREKSSGGILFVDGKAAFYSTLRQGLIGKEGSLDPAFLNGLADAVFEEPEQKLTFLAQTLGPGILAATEVPECVRRVVIATLRDTWFSVGGQEKSVFETRSGTSPGSPNADIQFQLIFAQVMQRVEDLLQELCEAAQASQHVRSNVDVKAVPPPSWMDDLAVPLRATDGTQLLEAVATVLKTLWQEMKAMGLDINFSQGKTELLPVIVGRGSRQARRELLCEAAAQHVVYLAPEHKVTLHLISKYVHLGALLDSSSDDAGAMRYRASLMREMIGPMQKLCRNQHLPEHTKRQLLCSMPLARLRHGSGFWRTTQTLSRQLYGRIYAEAPRRLLRPITGLSTHGLTDEDVYTVLQIASADEMRHADLVRQLGWLLAEPDRRLHSLWMADSTWTSDVTTALKAVVGWQGINVMQAWQLIEGQPPLAGIWARRYLKRCVKDKAAKSEMKRPQFMAMQKLREAGFIFCRRPAQPAKDPAHTCDFCSLAFSTAAARASHCQKVHAVAAPSAVAALGTACQVCRVQFWTTARLKQHMRQSTRCRTVVLAADLQADNADCTTGDTKAWLPATKLIGPQPWWACLTPPPENPLPTARVAPQRHIFSKLIAAGADLAKFRGAVRNALVQGDLVGVFAEDLPLNALALPKSHQDLLRLSMRIANFESVRSTTSCREGAWIGYACGREGLHRTVGTR